MAKDILTGYSLFEHYEMRTLQFLKKLVDNGQEPFFLDGQKRKITPNKYNIEAVIVLVATPYDTKALFTLRFEKQEPLIEKFRELFSNFPDLTTQLLMHLRNFNKIFDSAEIKKGNVRSIDFERYNLLTIGTDFTDNDIALRINKVYNELNRKPINEERVKKVRKGLAVFRKRWKVLRNEMAKYNYCDPLPAELK